MKSNACHAVIAALALFSLSFHLQAHGILPKTPKKGKVKRFRTDYNQVYCRTNTDTISPGAEFNVYVSNRGSDAAGGGSPSAAKLHVDSVQNLMYYYAGVYNAASIGLEADGFFREQFNTVVNNEKLGTYNLAKSRNMAGMSGMDVVKDWKATVGKTNVYEYLLYHTIELASPGYNYVIVSETDTVIEKTKPVTAVKYLTLARSIDDCERVAGTYYTGDLTTNPIKVYIHPSSGSPTTNRFRYEVTRRDFTINGFYVTGSRYEHLFLQSCGYGFGMLAAGYNSSSKNIIFQGGGTHHAVIASGSVDSCIFLKGPAGLQDRIAVVFAGDSSRNNLRSLSNSISNSIFVDIPFPVYSHTNGVNFKSLNISHIYAFGDTLDAHTALSAANTDSVVVADSYVEGYPRGWDGSLPSITIRNTVFRNISTTAINMTASEFPFCNVSINNVLIKTNGNDNNQVQSEEGSAYGVRASYNNVRVQASNMIIHAYSTWHQANQTVQLFKVQSALKAYRNVYICDVNDNNSVQVYSAYNSSGPGTSINVASDSNAYILLRGAGFHWNVSPVANNQGDIFNLSQWQALTGQDKHSIFIDLRNNPLGLRSVFVDPANGNWSLASTSQADSVRALLAGMTAPPLYYPHRPDLDNYRFYLTPSGISGLTGATNTNRESVLNWKTYNESGDASFVVEYSLDKINFTPVGSVMANVDIGNHNYQYVHVNPVGGINYYRLRILRTNGTIEYSPIIELVSIGLSGLTLTLYPNPIKSTLLVRHPIRGRAQIFIYDYSGRFVRLVNVSSGTAQTTVQTGDLPAGAYLVKWVSDTEMQTKTFVRSEN